MDYGFNAFDTPFSKNLIEFFTFVFSCIFYFVFFFYENSWILTGIFGFFIEE